jgi:hypothetical protein
MIRSAREAFIAYVLRRAAEFRQQRRSAPPDAENSSLLHASALVLLAEVVSLLPGDDDRMRALGTLAVREGCFAPGPGVEHAISQFVEQTSEACDAFLTKLVRIARDDALARARATGHLPPARPAQ